MVLFLVVTVFAFSASVHCLHLEDSEEGTCKKLHFQPLANTDFSFLDRFKYMSAGNRFYMYAMASALPNFDEMREFEFYYGLCFRHNATTSSQQASSIGFGGQQLRRYTFRPRRNQPAIIDVSPVPLTRRGRQHHLSEAETGFTKTVTLTDRKTFAFVVTCWEHSDLASWIVFSLTTELSLSAKRQIEQHALSLGFDRENMVFLNYNSCEDDIGENDGTAGHHWLPQQSQGSENRLVRAHGGSIGGPRTIAPPPGNAGWRQ